MTNEEARIELLEEYRIFLEGCGLENEEYLNQQMKDNDELRKVVEANRMAIKALEQQPSEDCVNREAVAEMLNEMPMKITETWMDFYRKALNSLNKLPSVTPQPKWIPVTERLPEDYVHVLCQFYLGGMGECYYLAHGSFHLVGGVVMTCNEVVAWMPLPQPYKAESEDKE